MLGNAISELSSDRTGFVSKMSQSADELRDRLHALNGGELTIDLLKSGFRDLDQIAKGLRAGQLCIVGARPGMGKTYILGWYGPRLVDHCFGSLSGVFSSWRTTRDDESQSAIVGRGNHKRDAVRSTRFASGLLIIGG